MVGFSGRRIHHLEPNRSFPVSTFLIKTTMTIADIEIRIGCLPRVKVLYQYEVGFGIDFFGLFWPNGM